MLSTIDLFRERIANIDLAFSIINDINNGSNSIQTYDNSRFLQILKSNLILMLYNLIESCIVNAFERIYVHIFSENCTYTDLIEEIRVLWSVGEISKLRDASTKTSATRVRQMINHVLNNQPLALTRDSLNISGNLDSRAIMRLCGKHKIRYVASDHDGHLLYIKNKRNELAHGDGCFYYSTSTLTISDLKSHKDGVIKFITDVINGMTTYVSNKEYLA
jgi:hypothetical protein